MLEVRHDEKGGSGRSHPERVDLHAVPLFAGCSRGERRTLERLGCRLRLRAGTTVCREGDWPAQFVILLEGHLVVVRRGRDPETRWPGSHIGAAELARRTPQSATVRAGSDVEIFVMSIREYETMVCQFPSVRARLNTTAPRSSPRLADRPPDPPEDADAALGAQAGRALPGGALLRLLGISTRSQNLVGWRN